MIVCSSHSLCPLARCLYCLSLRHCCVILLCLCLRAVCVLADIDGCRPSEQQSTTNDSGSERYERTVGLSSDVSKDASDELVRRRIQAESAGVSVRRIDDVVGLVGQRALSEQECHHQRMREAYLSAVHDTLAERAHHCQEAGRVRTHAGTGESERDEEKLANALSDVERDGTQWRCGRSTGHRQADKCRYEWYASRRRRHDGLGVREAECCAVLPTPSQ